MDTPGTQLSASDTPTGESLTFTTAPGQIAALRERVRGMTEMHNQHHAAAGGMHDRHGGGMGGPMMPPSSRATVEDVENGARIVVTPNDPAEVQKLLQSTVRMAEHMQRNGCGTMHGVPASR